jgi:ribulose-5-phosphate 4-epimerase/fuculose-1-phosphate aldolase
MKSGAVVHLHSTNSVALSMLPGINVDSVLPPYTPYSIMLLGKVKLLPFFVPGDPAMGEAIKGLAGKRSAVLLANHGPVVSGKTLEASVNAIEELENTAKLVLILRGSSAIELDENQIKSVVNKFNIEWD